MRRFPITTTRSTSWDFGVSFRLGACADIAEVTVRTSKHAVKNCFIAGRPPQKFGFATLSERSKSNILSVVCFFLATGARAARDRRISLDCFREHLANNLRRFIAAPRPQQFQSLGLHKRVQDRAT